jgi:hypothetical protein
MRAGVQMPAKVEILDMIEEGNRVAVRWQVTAIARNGNPYEGSCVAIYRFENGRRCSGTLAVTRYEGLKSLVLTKCPFRERQRAAFAAPRVRTHAPQPTFDERPPRVMRWTPPDGVCVPR